MLSSLFESILGRSTLISPDDNWALLFVLVASVSIAICLEQKYAWASKLSGTIIALVLALLLSNLGIIPTSCILYDDIVWGYAVPLGIPLLLLQCNIKKSWRETGRLLTIFLIGAVGTICGAFLSYALFRNCVPEPAGVAAMMTGSYIGGSLNLAALAGEFSLSGETVGATTVADNLLMAVYFFVLILFAGLRFFRKNYNHPHIDAVEYDDTRVTTNMASSFWKRKEISLRDIAIDMTYSVTVVFLAKIIAGILSMVIPASNIVLSMCNAFFGSQYIWITTLAMLYATICEEQVQKMNGTQEIGTYFIYLFLFVIGVPASVVEIIKNAPLLLVFTGLMVVCNMVFCFVAGKILKYDLEEIILASNANIGGPTTAAGMAIAQGWSRLVGPTMVIGTLGYVLGTYLGVIIGNILGA